MLFSYGGGILLLVGSCPNRNDQLLVSRNFRDSSNKCFSYYLKKQIHSFERIRQTLIILSISQKHFTMNSEVKSLHLIHHKRRSSNIYIRKKSLIIHHYHANPKIQQTHYNVSSKQCHLWYFRYLVDIQTNKELAWSRYCA